MAATLSKVKTRQGLSCAQHAATSRLHSARISEFS